MRTTSTFSHLAMRRKRILFQGSYKAHRRTDTSEDRALAEPMCASLGNAIVRAGFDLILTSTRSLGALVGKAAVEACEHLGIEPRDRIRTYPYGNESVGGVGMVIRPMDKRWQEVRTFIVGECDAVVTILGGKGTSDSLQKAHLAGKPVFPIAVTGGASYAEWEKLKRSGYSYADPGDIDFLADRGLAANSMCDQLCDIAQSVLMLHANYSRRVFIVHGHDRALKNDIARFLEKLAFTPVILHEQPDRGRSILEKLRDELSDVGFGLILLTPDDVAFSKSRPDSKNDRARQNVVFEHGLLIGLLGTERVCAIVRGSVEIPSDLSGVVYKHLRADQSVDAIAMELVKELRSAHYDVDANMLLNTN